MNEPSNLNPEIIFNNFKQTPEIEMKQSKIPSFSNSEFNPEIDAKINNTQNQDSDEILLLNSSEMIGICISQIVFDDAAYDQSTKISLFDESGRRIDASLLPEVLCSNISYTIPVRKSADAPQGNGEQNDTNSSVGSNNGSVSSHPNVAAANNGDDNNEESVTGPLNNPNNNNDDNDDDDDDDEEVNLVEPVQILICRNNATSRNNEVHGRVPLINTNIYAKNYENWNRFAAAIYIFWMQHNNLVIPHQLARDAEGEEIVEPEECCPGYDPYFGHFEAGSAPNRRRFNRVDGPQQVLFRWVRAQINGVLLRPRQQQ